VNKAFPPDVTDAVGKIDDEHAAVLHDKIELPEIYRPPARLRRHGRLFAFGGLLVLGGSLSVGAWEHYLQEQEAKAAAKRSRDFVPSVSVAPVVPSSGTVSVTLPGTTAAFADASIYARATGYITKRSVDIGDRVKAGDLLAELAVPELDDQISQNEATLNQLKSALEQAEANRKLAGETWARDKPLVEKGWATQHQGDIDVQTLKAQEAAVAVAQQNVLAQVNLLKTLRQDRQYALVTAPFDGVITQRNVDVGSLVQGNATSGTFMFEIMQNHVIRVWIYVPQDEAFGVKPGDKAIVRVPELPDREFPGTVTRIADAQQSGTRTLLTEIDLPNPDGALRSGIYCMVALEIPRKTPSYIVSADALIFNSKGMQVAIAHNGKAEIRKIKVTRDLGTTVEVGTGIEPGDEVILNPPIDLVDGGRVEPRTTTVAAEK
jgi:RND family efflux transporter MFP subunit